MPAARASPKARAHMPLEYSATSRAHQALVLSASLAAVAGCDRRSEVAVRNGAVSMKALRATEHPLVIRADFSSDAAWAEVREAIRRPSPTDGFVAYVQFLDDRAFDGLSKGDVVRLARPAYGHGFVFIVDRHTIEQADHAVLVVQIDDEREFRVIPSEMWSVENNLSIANIDWDEFASEVDETNTFRGFPPTPAQ